MNWARPNPTTNPNPIRITETKKKNTFYGFRRNPFHKSFRIQIPNLQITKTITFWWPTDSKKINPDQNSEQRLFLVKIYNSGRPNFSSENISDAFWHTWHPCNMWICNLTQKCDMYDHTCDKLTREVWHNRLYNNCLYVSVFLQLPPKY